MASHNEADSRLQRRRLVKDRTCFFLVTHQDSQISPILIAFFVSKT